MSFHPDYLHNDEYDSSMHFVPKKPLGKSKAQLEFELSKAKRESNHPKKIAELEHALDRAHHYERDQERRRGGFQSPFEARGARAAYDHRHYDDSYGDPYDDSYGDPYDPDWQYYSHLDSDRVPA